MNCKPRIVVLNPTCLDVIERYHEWIESLGVELIADSRFRQLTTDSISTVLSGAHAVVIPAVVPLTAATLQAIPTLRVLSISGSGFETVDVGAATRCGIVVTNAPIREGAETVADLTWGLMLSVARQIPHHNQLVVGGLHERGMGTVVWGKTLGILGLGSVGRAVARRAKGFEMRIIAASARKHLSDSHIDQEQYRTADDKRISDTRLDFFNEHNIQLMSVNDLLRQSDFVSLHVRLNNMTSGLIGNRELRLMKPSAYLINTARRGLVDERALTEAISNGRIAGAAMDDPLEITDSPLLGLPNFVCTPHIGNRAIEGVHAVCKCALENALAVIRRRRPEFVINPEVYERGGRWSELGSEKS